MGVVQNRPSEGNSLGGDLDPGAAGARRQSGAEEGEAACGGRCGGGSASPARRDGVVQSRVLPGFEPRLDPQRHEEWPLSLASELLDRPLRGAAVDGGGIGVLERPPVPVPDIQAVPVLPGQHDRHWQLHIL